tara:strand:- start:169 stop:420 length:252 start_codon:yes stop_codon:yes gene_type:complete
MKKPLNERFQQLAGIKPLNELEDDQNMSQTDKLLRRADILTDEERDYAGDVLMKMHQQLNPTLDIEKSKEILDFTIATLQEMY